MHDYFEILGLPVDAPASEIRRAYARRLHRTHPDFRPVPTGALAPVPTDWSSNDPVSPDVAVDFVEVAALVDRIQAAFFTTPE